MTAAPTASALDDPPHGAFPPTRLQSVLIALFHGTPLGYSRLRRIALDRFRDARPGPVDASLFGLKVRFHPRENQTDAKSALFGPCYNGRESRWLRRSLPQGGTFVDVGANMGFFSLLAATRAARVVAIEPLPAMFERLRWNMTRNAVQAVLFNAAAGSRDGEVGMVPDASDYGSSRVVEAGGSAITVPVRPLLAMVQEAGLERIDLLKIDIEGYEDRALAPFFRDAPRTLWPRAIIVEESARAAWLEDLTGVLAAAGYARRAGSRGNAWWCLAP